MILTPKSWARRVFHARALLTAVPLLCSAAWAGNPLVPTEQPGAAKAVWTAKQVHFVYHGFTTHYSCEGLRDKVRKALLELGAAKDLKVREGACTRPSGGPECKPACNIDQVRGVTGVQN